MDSVQDTLAGGFPHSEIHGSKSVRNSPWLIAAYDVLHRLSAPRHPPNALKTLDRSHYRCPPARQQTESHFRKDQLLRGRVRSQAVKSVNLATCPGNPPGHSNKTFSSRCRIARARPRKRERARIDVSGGRRSTPNADALVEPDGIEPTTSCLQSRRSPN
jgi:hypothetical protein